MMKINIFLCLVASVLAVACCQDVTWIDNFCYKLKEKFGNIDNKLNSTDSRAQQALQKATEPRQGCQSGQVGEHSYPTVKFPVVTQVTFNPPFDEIPAVTYGLFLLDSNKEQNVRVSTKVDNLSTTGFKLTIKSFADTVMWGARISWMACPKNI